MLNATGHEAAERLPRRILRKLQDAVEGYVARGTGELSEADATRVRRLAAWILVFMVLLPVIVIAQIVRPQYVTALVNACYGTIAVACWEWALRGKGEIVKRAMRAQDVILAATVVDLVLTALLNSGINGTGLWYLSIIPLFVAAQSGAREAIAWTAVAVGAVCFVALVDPYWPFARDLEVEPVDLVVTMRILMMAALCAFAITSVQAMNRYVAAIEEREQRLKEQTVQLAAAKNETDAARVTLQRHLDALLHVSLAAATARSSDEQATAALDEIVRILGAERAFLFLCSDENDIAYKTGRNASCRDLAPEEFRATRLVAESAGRREPLLRAGESDPGDAGGPRSVIAAPLLLESRLIGVVCVDNPVKRASFTADDAQILLAVGNHMAIALEGARTAAERDDAERRLRESEERFRQLMAQAGDALYLAKAGGWIIEANRQACEILGYTREELLARTVYDLDASLTEAEGRQLLDQLDLRGNLATERLLRRKDGSLLPVEARVSRIEVRGERHVLIAARDITERLRAERALRTSEQNFRSVFENLVDIFYRTDLQGTIQMLSPSVERYGYHAPHLIGKPVTDFYLDPAERDRLLRVLLAEGDVSDFEITMKRGDGTPVLVSASARLIFDDTGRPLGMEGVLRDISERKQAEEQLAQSHAQLRALSNRLLAIQEEERHRIAREVHDELGGTLTALSLDVNWLAAHTADPAVREKIAKIADLLDATMGSVQRIARELRPLLLDDLGLVPALQWLVREFQERTRITCTLTVPPGGITLDQERATTVFRLVQEALTNVARHAQASRVAVSFRRGRGQILLSIEDDGRGIRDEEIHHRDSLGLLGMHERVRIWDGTMHIEGLPDKGTRLQITIPLASRRRENLSEEHA